MNHVSFQCKLSVDSNFFFFFGGVMLKLQCVLELCEIAYELMINSFYAFFLFTIALMYCEQGLNSPLEPDEHSVCGGQVSMEAQ